VRENQSLWYRQSTLVLNMQYKHREPLIKSQNTLSRHTQGQASLFWRMPESSQNKNLLDAGRFGLHVLSRHFLHPVGRIHQHDEAHR